MKYAGDVKPTYAFDILKNEKNSYLVDVRTLPEWNISGIPDLSSINKEVLPVSWMFYPRMDLNIDFATQLEQVIADKDAKIFFLCKVGGRSLDAAIAMTDRGYKNCYNIAGGFEGPLNEEGKRGRIAGWKAEQLPWQQA